MKPFVINRHGRLVFPTNFLGESGGTACCLSTRTTTDDVRVAFGE